MALVGSRIRGYEPKVAISIKKKLESSTNIGLTMSVRRKDFFGCQVPVRGVGATFMQATRARPNHPTKFGVSFSLLVP